MQYIGLGGTVTPAHKDICGSLGHNIIIYAEEPENKRLQGSETMALWLMAQAADKEKVAAFWEEQVRLGSQLA
jgi:hypothetical protein